jgi:TolB-like protein/Tfp pilus assembly protein PilF
MSLITELKRRNVFRVGIAYVVAAWLLAQIADLILDVMGAPDIVLRSVVAILALGFLPAVIFAWAFEMTPEGVKKEADIDRSTSITQHTAKKLDFVTIGLVIAAVIFVVVERYLPDVNPAMDPGSLSQSQTAEAIAQPADTSNAVSSKVDEHSIAVLPFANRSNQDDDLFFTDGIHDDLLTQLAKIHDLTVISRTSVMKYRDTSKNLKEIGIELGVATILEGGIQKVGNRVRINAQLIEVASDKHLWAETFDRELTAENIFDIQSEISREIVKAVAIQLTPEEEQLLREVPTQNLAAYEAYLRARELYFAANYSRDQEEAAQPWLEKAIILDPNFAEAHAILSTIYGQAYWRGINTSPEFLTLYRNTIDKALSLNPNSPSALRASANYYYRVKNDYRKSKEILREAVKIAPGNVDLHGDLGLSNRRLGLWEESIASFQRALELDPDNRFYHALMNETMGSARQWQAIIDNTVPLQDANPDDLDIQITRAEALFNLNGDLQPMERVFEKMNLVATTNYTAYSARIYWLKRDADAVIEVLNNPIWTSPLAAQSFRDFRSYELANAYRLKGDEEKSRQLFEGIVNNLDEIMNSALQVQAYGGMLAAISMARLGDYDAALALAEKLTTSIPWERDAMLSGWLLTYQAMVKGLAGDQEAAIDDLELALTIPTAQGITVWDLYYDPNWDFLRDNPRFNALATPENIIR